MKKYRSYSVFQKTLSALLCLSMVLSVVTGTGLPELFNLTESVDAAEETSDPNEYKDETLEHMWDSDGDGDPTDEKYWNTARSYYACAATSEENAKKGAFQNWGVFIKEPYSMFMLLREKLFVLVPVFIIQVLIYNINYLQVRIKKIVQVIILTKALLI